jgi:2-dehydro-3-deoxyphosphogluconate aldolase/(4S)-4-hydroxy-2-oxoglutarate aldolase
VPDAIARAGVVPVVTLDDARHADPLVDALAGGGLPVVEITLRTAAGLAALRRVAHRGDVTVGAGTVTTGEQAERAVDAGARFVVSPGLDEDVVRVCLRRGVPVVPGVATPTELMRARRLGLTVVKLFPAGPLGGPAMVRALAALDPDVRFLPTGGVTRDSAPDYLALPCVLAVGGTWMAPAAAVSAGDWARVGALAARCRELTTKEDPR